MADGVSMRRLWWMTILLATLLATLLVLGACSDASNNSDAGDGDAGDGGELEGCALV